MNLLDQAEIYEKKNNVCQDEKPLFHVTPHIGWMNDPNGFSVFQGKIHLFYQYHPYSPQWGPMYWGHQITDDMICWKEYPIALAPDQSYDCAGCFSGSAIETKQGHILVYTGVSKSKDGKKEIQNQCIAIGDGIHYQKIDDNPVIIGSMLPDGFNHSHFRDPKIWKDNDTYYLVAGNLDALEQGQIVLFSSYDLKSWKYECVLAHSQGTMGKMWECPDFFELDGKHVLICSPQYMQAREYEFHNGHNSIYFLGDYDKNKKVFQKEEPLSLDYGLDFYAPQTTCLPDGRRILIAWMKSWHTSILPSHQKWEGMMTLPREISLKEGRLIQKPVRELECYHKNKVTYHEEILNDKKVFDKLYGRTIDMTIEILSSNYHELKIDLAKNERYYTEFLFNKDKNILEIDRSYSGVIRDVNCIRRAKIKYPKATLKLRFILDRNSIELFVNDGDMVLSTVIYTPQEAQGIELSCDGEAIFNIVKYDIEL